MGGPQLSGDVLLLVQLSPAGMALPAGPGGAPALPGLRPLLPLLPELLLTALQATHPALAAQLHRVYGLPAAAGGEVLDAITALGALHLAGLVERSWQQPELVGPPTVPSWQGYLQPPAVMPNGQPSPYGQAWGVGLAGLPDLAAQDGAGERLWIIERGWHRSHLADSLAVADLPEPALHGVVSDQFSERSHGTNVLGVLAMDRGNGLFGFGLCPAADYRLVAARRQPGLPHELYAALVRVLIYGQAGDVLLVEEQVQAERSPGDLRVACIDVDPLAALILSFLVRSGIVVVLPAGNGDADLEELRIPLPGGLVPPAWLPPESIVVGGISPVDGSRAGISNFGSRVRTFAWSTNVYTVDVRRDPFTGSALSMARFDFSGTSAAAAIVAGVAVLAQAMKRKKTGQRLDTSRMLGALLYEATPSADPTSDRVGGMPNLERIRWAIEHGLV